MTNTNAQTYKNRWGGGKPEGGSDSHLGDKFLFGTLRNHKANFLRLWNDLINMRVYIFHPRPDFSFDSKPNL